jgi:hypothetical protein
LACHAKKNENYSIKFGAWLGRSYRVWIAIKNE